MDKLTKYLKEWIALGFINQDQAQRIQEYEAARSETSWIQSGLLILGAVIVGIGIISLIAANWEHIPNSIKLGGDFALLFVLALATVHFWEKNIQFEVLLLSFLISCLASIGLISQIYHTGGKLYQALMLWSLITFPLVLAARQLFVPFLWTGTFLTGIVFTAVDAVSLQPIFQKNYPAVLMTVPLLCASLIFALNGLAGETPSTRAFRYWTLISGLAALIVAELSTKVFPFSTCYIPGYFLATWAAFGIWRSTDYRNMQKILLLLTLALFLVPFHLPFWQVKAYLTYAIFTILILGLISVFLASIKERRLFQWFLFFLGIRFLILYFQALGGLATTGMGLILSGGMVIGVTILWNKYRSRLAVWAERWMQ